MPNSPDSDAPPRKTAPTYKEKGTVQRSVVALLDELAPEKTLTRSERVPLTVEQHRSPTGCVLQGPDYALSISWFPEDSRAAELGELHIISWSGTVARRGATRHTKGAKVVAEMVLTPIEPPVGGNLWRDSDGAVYNTQTLAAKCLALLSDMASSK